MIKRERKQSVFVEIISALFVVLFVYAAMSKMLDLEKFRVELGKSPILSSVSTYVSMIVPISEIMIAILLINKGSQKFALYASFSAMVIFSSYILVILNFSPYIPCSCGGILNNMTWSQHLIFNIGFVVLGILGVLFHPKNTKNLSAVRG